MTLCTNSNSEEDDEVEELQPYKVRYRKDTDNAFIMQTLKATMQSYAVHLSFVDKGHLWIHLNSVITPAFLAGNRISTSVAVNPLYPDHILGYAIADLGKREGENQNNVLIFAYVRPRYRLLGVGRTLVFSAMDCLKINRVNLALWTDDAETIAEDHNLRYLGSYFFRGSNKSE